MIGNLTFRIFLEEDERVIKVFRRPFTLAIGPILLKGLVWAGLIYVMWFLYHRYNEVDLRLLWAGVGILAFYQVFGGFFVWYYNAIVMTNEGLIFVKWRKLFDRSYTRIDFHNLDEIEVTKKGVRSFFLNYGTMNFQKVNGGESYGVKKINRPVKVSRIIERYREDMINAKNFTEESALKHLLSQMVQSHVGEHGQPSREVEQYKLHQQKARLDTDITEEEREDFLALKLANKLKSKKKKKPKFERQHIEVEKELDDDGGIGIDLD